MALGTLALLEALVSLAKTKLPRGCDIAQSLGSIVFGGSSLLDQLLGLCTLGRRDDSYVSALWKARDV